MNEVEINPRRPHKDPSVKLGPFGYLKNWGEGREKEREREEEGKGRGTEEEGEGGERESFGF